MFGDLIFDLWQWSDTGPVQLYHFDHQVTLLLLPGFHAPMLHATFLIMVTLAIDCLAHWWKTTDVSQNDFLTIVGRTK